MGDVGDVGDVGAGAVVGAAGVVVAGVGSGVGSGAPLVGVGSLGASAARRVPPSTAPWVPPPPPHADRPTSATRTRATNDLRDLRTSTPTDRTPTGPVTRPTVPIPGRPRPAGRAGTADQLRRPTTRATRTISTSSEQTVCNIIRAFTRREITASVVGPNVAFVLKAMKR